MPNIRISNFDTVDTPAGETTVKKDIVGSWFVEYDSQTVTTGEVLIEGVITVKHSYPTTRLEREHLKDEITIGPERFEIWKQSGFEPMVLLLALIHAIDPDSSCADELETLPWEYITESTNYLLSFIIPNCCGCGRPKDALNAINRVMGSFKGDPLSSGEFGIYKNPSDLVIAYQIDARNIYINHGGSIGNSWLEIGGVLWRLAATLELSEPSGS